MNIADKAKDVVFGDRQLNYGKPERNQALIAELWSAYTGADISAHIMPPHPISKRNTTNKSHRLHCRPPGYAL